MGVPDLLHLLVRTSSRSKQCYPLIGPVSASLHIPIKVAFDQRSYRYSGGPSGEKGTSTAEEFQRVAAEKRKQDEDSGGKPQVFEESDQQTVKKKFKEEEKEKPKRKAE